MNIRPISTHPVNFQSKKVQQHISFSSIKDIDEYISAAKKDETEKHKATFKQISFGSIKDIKEYVSAARRDEVKKNEATLNKVYLAASGKELNGRQILEAVSEYSKESLEKSVIEYTPVHKMLSGLNDNGGVIEAGKKSDKEKMLDALESLKTAGFIARRSLPKDCFILTDLGKEALKSTND